ncbi:MAG: hypothetical protein IPN69_24155 [Acidobacteria bacterium]|nr:hypothetical protein [Acidobacteriota bacterium]
MLNHTIWSRSRLVGLAILTTIATTILLIYAAGSNAAVFSFGGAGSGLVSNPLPATGRSALDAPETTCAPAPPGMVGWWPGDGNTTDVVGGNNGTLENGATFTAGKVGQGFGLGSGSYVSLPNSTSTLLNDSSGTIAAWVYPTAVGDNDIVAAFGSGADGQGIGIGVWTTVRIYHHTGAYDWQSNTPVSANTWTFLVYTWDSTTERIYKDGSFSESRPRNFNYVPGAARIGHGFWGDPANLFPGLIDEVAIFNRTLDPAEITSIYDAGSAGMCGISCTAAPNGMVSWWSADGNVFDIANGYHGALRNGATFVPGKVDRAFSFDGIDDYFEVSSNPDLNLINGLTLESWFFRRAGGSATLFSKADYNGSASIASYNLQINPDGAVNVALYGSYPADNWTTVPGLVGTGRWYHIALTWNGTYGPTDNVRLYLDGELVQSWTKSATLLNSNTESLTMGSMKPPTYYGRFDGLMDEPRIFNLALTQTEIRAIYNANQTGICRTCTQPPSDLISWWSGDGNANDLISGYNGILKNGAAFASGKVGQAFLLDGVDDHVLAPNTTNINGGTESTYDAWVYPTAVPAVDSYFGILGVGDSTLPTWTTQQCRLLYWRQSGSPAGSARFYFDCGLDNNENRIGRLSANDYPIDSWNFVSAVFNNGTLDLYVNGVLDNGDLTGTGGSSINTNSDKYVWIGAQVRNSDASLYVPFKGKIDEPEIFSRALTATEIIAIYNAGSAGKCRPALGKAYVPNGGGGTVSVIDVATSAVDATITAGTGYGFVAIKNDGSKAYVSGAALSKISVIDTSANTLLTEFTLPGATHGLAVNLAGTRLYVAQESGNSVWVLDADSGALLATVPIGVNPFGVAITPDGSRVYTSNYSNGSVSAIRTSDNSVVTIPTGSLPYGIAASPDSSRVYVANYGSNSVSVIDTATNTIVADVAFQFPTGIAVNKAGTRVYVGSDTNNILSIDTSNNIGSLIPVGRRTVGISVSPDGSRVAAAARINNQVVIVNTGSNSVIDIAVGDAPHSLGLFIAQGLTATSPAAPDSCDPKPVGITHWWRGQGNALDAQKGIHATPVNHTTFAPGIVGKAFSFDGVDDYASAPAFDMGPNWTIEGWIKPVACSDNAHCMMITRSIGGTDGLVLGYMGPSHSAANEFQLNIGGPGWDVILRSRSKYSPGTWYHVAATKNGDNYRLYVNGGLKDEVTIAGVSAVYQSREIALGRWNWGASPSYTNGMIDEVAIYKRALSSAEIFGIYFADTYGKCAAGMSNTDLDGDMSTDLTIFRPNGATGTEWWTLRSSTGGNWAAQFGDPTDRIVAEDFTGDGKTDVAIFRPSNSNWYILRSEDYSYYSFPFGTTGDIAVPADYDGDGIADPAVYRPSTGVWYIARSTGGLGQERFGFPTDKPVPADYDGDGRIDIAIYRPSNGQWWLNRTTEGLVVHTFGNDADYNVPGDFTGDGKADVAIFRPSDNNWYVLRSEDYTYYSFPFGAAGDIPAAGDFDGDAVFDAAVFRPSDGKWYLKRSTAGITVIPFGAPGDIPVPGAFIR